MTWIVRVAFVVFLVLAVISWFKKDALPPESDILPELQLAPQQKRVEHGPIELVKEGTRYTIHPLYSYTLRGLVVSHHDSFSWLDYMHGAWGDKLNVRDLCVVWGGNVQNELYKRFSFRSGDFTCFYKTDNRQAWSAFTEDELSNNHLLAGSSAIQKQIGHAETGDQVAFKGFLAKYEHDGGFKRGTSINRTDRGNGACETVFVTQFTMLQKGNVLWRRVWDISSFGAGITFVAGLALFVTGAVSTSYKSPDDFHEKGAQLAARGRLKRALAMLDKALEMDPELVEAYRDRALVYERLGHYELAQQDEELARRIEKRLKPVNEL